jgi:hypothetical protein
MYLPVNFSYEYLFHTVSILACCKILRHETTGFISPPKEIVLRIFIALENPSCPAEFEPATLEPSGKHDYHYHRGLQKL